MRWSVVVALVMACKGDPRPPPAAPVAPPKRADAIVKEEEVIMPSISSVTISSDGVGPVTANTPPSAVAIRPLFSGFEVTSEHHEAEDFNFDEILVAKRTPLLRIVVDNMGDAPRLFKIEVFDPMFATASGVTTGMTVAELAAKLPDIACKFEHFEPDADAERVEKLLHCASPSLPHVTFDLDDQGFRRHRGRVPIKIIETRRIAKIVWLH